MNVDPAAPAAPSTPAPQPAAAGNKRKRKWAPPAPKASSRMLLLIIGGAAALMVVLLFVMSYAFKPGPRPAQLQQEFRNYDSFYAIKPPRNWIVDDRVLKDRLVIQGLRETRFQPLMTVSSEPAPGKLADFLKAHKARIKAEEPSTNFVSESTESIDGREAIRLEYDCDYSEVPEASKFKLRTVQFIIHDQPYYIFYKITCHARADTFEEHKAVFELSARSFHLLPMPKFEPKFLNE